MARHIKNALVAALVAALGSIGVSYAATGSLNPVTVLKTSTATPGGDPEVTGAAEGQGERTGKSKTLPAGAAAARARQAGNSADAAGPPERSDEGCPPGFTGNHGQFVRNSEHREHGRSWAAQLDCGKPVQATDNDAESEDEDAGPASEDEDRVRGNADGHSKNKDKGNGGS